MSNSKITILFQGDSITDVGRAREIKTDLGNGYVKDVASLFATSYPNMNVNIINKGISGDRAKDLKARWQEDCINFNPDIISIFVGINDCWRRYDNNDPTTAEVFEKDYRYILQEIKDKTNAKIILCEPFVLPFPEDRKAWREDLDPKIEVVHKLAKEFNALLLPLDKIFKKALISNDSASLAEDGVHPTDKGHALIAKEWMKVVEEII